MNDIPEIVALSTSAQPTYDINKWRFGDNMTRKEDELSVDEIFEGCSAPFEWAS